MQLFEYAVIINEKRNKDNDVVEEGKIINDVTTVLAKDLAQATLLASRQIPEDYTTPDKLDRVVVAVRPF